MSSFLARGALPVVILDLLAVAVLAVLMKLTSDSVEWIDLLDKDLYGILVSVVLGISFVAYAGFVYSIDRPKIIRLRKSAQFKNLLRTMLAYCLIVIVAYLGQKLLSDFGLAAIAVAIVGIYRTVWIYWKTIALV